MPVHFKVVKKTLYFCNGVKNLSVGDDFRSNKDAKAFLSSIPPELDTLNLEHDTELKAQLRLLRKNFDNQLQDNPRYAIVTKEMKYDYAARKEIERNVYQPLEYYDSTYGLLATEQTITSNPSATVGYNGMSILRIEPIERLLKTEKVRKHYPYGNSTYEVDEPVKTEDGRYIEKATDLPFPEFNKDTAFSHYKPVFNYPTSKDYKLYRIVHLHTGFVIGAVPKKDVAKCIKEHEQHTLLELSDTVMVLRYQNTTRTLNKRYPVERL